MTNISGLHYESLPDYHSYDLAWLGPIIYPLTLAVLAQAFVLYDMCRVDNKREHGWLARRLTGLGGAPAPADRRVTLITLTVMLSEMAFAILCIIQCIINYSSRSFVGLSSACDFQAFYATYYTFSSVGVFAVAILYGARIILTDATCPLFSLPVVIFAAVGVHGLALLLSALPLMGVGNYLFATDYCQYNVEGGVFAPLVFVWLIGGLAVVAASSAAVCAAKRPTAHMAMRCGTAPADGGAAAADGAPLRRSAVQLFAVSTLYYVASWTTTLVIISLYWANGNVFDSPQWRVYGAQAIILHSNQLVVPLLIGFWWRHLMNAVVANSAAGTKGVDVASDA